MIFVGLAGLMIAGAVDLRPLDPASDTVQIQLAQLTIRERIIVRVPTRMVPVPTPPTKFKEKSAPNCVEMTAVAGAALLNPTTVDFILPGGARVRTLLESSCPALDFYTGFYLLPTSDGKLCVGRDAIHARSGGECQIKKFKRLIPVR